MHLIRSIQRPGKNIDKRIFVIVQPAMAKEIGEGCAVAMGTN